MWVFLKSSEFRNYSLSMKYSKCLYIWHVCSPGNQEEEEGRLYSIQRLGADMAAKGKPGYVH